MNSKTSYDQIIYQSLPRRETHPNHLSVIASLFGIKTAPVTKCRVLELGCGTGGNIIPMAADYPESRFLGIDLSTVQIKEGRQVISDLQFKNIELQVESIQEFRKRKEKFDYIICHGVFSWVDRNVQNQILKIFAEHLSEVGIGYLSYNTLPGWRMQGAVREMMQYHTAAIEEPSEKVEQARALLQFLAESRVASDAPYAKFIDQSFNELKKAPDYYLFHEYLEEVNDAFYFNQVAERATKQGLHYIGDAQFGLMGTADLSPEANKVLEELKDDRVRYEQYLDFLRNRKLRESLFCNQHTVPKYPADGSAIRSAYCAAHIQSKSALFNLASSQLEVFSHANGGEIRTDAPIVKAALSCLSSEWPRAVHFAALFKRAAGMIGLLEESGDGQRALDEMTSDFFAFFNAHLIDLSATPSQCTGSITTYPHTSPLARYQALKQEHVTSFRHKAVKLESISRQILALLDGTRSVPEILERLRLLHSKGELVIEGFEPGTSDRALTSTLTALIEKVLAQLGKQGFLLEQ